MSVSKLKDNLRDRFSQKSKMTNDGQLPKRDDSYITVDNFKSFVNDSTAVISLCRSVIFPKYAKIGRVNASDPVSADHIKALLDLTDKSIPSVLAHYGLKFRKINQLKEHRTSGYADMKRLAVIPEGSNGLLLCEEGMRFSLVCAFLGTSEALLLLEEVHAPTGNPRRFTSLDIDKFDVLNAINENLDADLSDRLVNSFDKLLNQLFDGEISIGDILNN